MFGFVKNNVYVTFTWQRNGWWWKSWIINDNRKIIWYLFAGLNLVFKSCPVYMIREICFQQKYDSWKPQLESWNTNHDSLNRTLHTETGQLTCYANIVQIKWLASIWIAILSWNQLNEYNLNISFKLLGKTLW